MDMLLWFVVCSLVFLLLLLRRSIGVVFVLMLVVFFLRCF